MSPHKKDMPEEIVETFTSRLKKILRDQGRTNRWLADRLEMTEQTLYNRFEKNNWMLSEYEEIRKILGIEL